MLRIKAVVLLALVCMLVGCTSSNNADGYTFTDSLGRAVTVNEPKRVAALMGSYAEAWILAGGSLVGVTADAIEERTLELNDDVKIVGTVKKPSLEEILALEPDFIILSADIEGHLELKDTFEQMGINTAYFKVEEFKDYLNMLRIFTDITGNKNAYQTYGLEIGERIDTAIAGSKGKNNPRILLIRAFSTGAKVKGEDTMTGIMLRDLGSCNIATDSLLEELSIEKIIESDPDFIFVTTMGDEKKALNALDNTLLSNPAWNGLSAVKKGRFVVLPKELFHYKPNARWGESYEYLADVLYGKK